MKKRSSYPSKSELQALLLKRQQDYCDLTGMAPSALGRLIRKDSTLFSDIESGRNITLDTYQQIMDWFDAHWPTAEAATAAK